MTLLSIVQSAAVRIGLSKPTVAASSTDPKILQLVDLINEDGQELASRSAWQELTVESNFTTVATESQGSIATLAGPDCNFILNEVLWNRTERRPMFGPRSPAQWQQLKAQFTTGPWLQYRIRANQLLFLPAPPPGESVYFEWISKNWCQTASAVTAATMVNDTDVSRLDERLSVLGAIWRFKAANQLEYSEDFRVCEDAIADAIGRNSTKPILNLGGEPSYFYPGVLIPAGSWAVS